MHEAFPEQPVNQPELVRAVRLAYKPCSYVPLAVITNTRYEEKRTREAWTFLRRLEETARGEELVRMRAEERFTRSLLDLELQDSLRVEIAQREAEEKTRLWSEDLAVRQLKRLQKDQLVERETMMAEDVLARTWKSIQE